VTGREQEGPPAGQNPAGEMRRFAPAFLLTVLALVAVPAGPGHAASACDSHVLVFSGKTLPGDHSTAVAEPEKTACAAGAQADARLIMPGSDVLMIRYEFDYGDQVAALGASVTGLGVSGSVTLWRKNYSASVQDLRYDYDSDYIVIDPARRGPLTITVHLPGGGTDSTTYSTAV
jgi:hypothetical protein